MSAAIAFTKARAIAAVPIQPAARPGSLRQPKAFTRKPAKGKASTSHA
jgi:hypothetical protein